MSESLERCLKTFFDLSTHGIRGLSIIREDPEELVKNYDVKPDEIIVLSQMPLKGFKAVSDLQDISLTISKFLEGGRGVVLLDGLEYLISRFDFNSIYRFLQEKRFEFLNTSAILLVPVNLETLDPREKALLLSELKPLK